MSTSLVIQTSFLGDTVLTTPLLAELARRGSVDVVVTRASAPLLAHDLSVRRVHVFDKTGADRGALGLTRVASRIREAWRAHGDDPRRVHAYLAQGSLRSAMLAALARAAMRTGFDDAAGRLLYTTRVPRRTGDHHAARLLSLADGRPASARAAAITPRLYPGDDDRRTVDELLATHRSDRPLAALAPGSIWGTKRWPYYRELAEHLATRFRIAIIGGADDATLAREIARVAGADTLDATGRLTILASAELIGRAQVLVTNDSLPQHLASAMGTPTVTVFGPTVSEFGFGPLAPHSMTLGVETLACRPCHHHGPRVCPLGHWRCMKDLDVTRVETAVDVITAATTR
ncbi:MAG TPA: glycosyltransferase family 9 protein [Gemmatimonadaceae bacterium]|nr:glycosyltransferase family 9 protein [Gemmatimonadaceae bacterium]